MVNVSREDLIKKFLAGERDFSGTEIYLESDLSNLNLSGINMIGTA